MALDTLWLVRIDGAKLPFSWRAEELGLAESLAGKSRYPLRATVQGSGPNRASPARVAIEGGGRFGFTVVRAWSPAPMPSNDPSRADYVHVFERTHQPLRQLAGRIRQIVGNSLTRLASLWFASLVGQRNR